VGVLMNAGLSDWVADGEEEYVAKTVLFASDLDKLASLRAGLRSQVLASPLFDAPRFARNIEQALWDMWNQWDPTSTPKEMRKLQKESTQNKSVETETPDSRQDQKRRAQKIYPIPSAQASAQEQMDALIALYNQGQFEEVVTQTTALLKQFPQAIILHNIQGAANAGLQLFDAAIENYQRALLINPDYVEAHNNLGIALKNKGDLTAAIKTFNRALQIKPDHTEVHNNLGTALKQEGNLIAAIKSYNRA
ncbi:MAG: tetratricopeptide repeat protein, partial [Rhodobacterales bacterium]